MSLITPIELKERFNKAIRNTPRIVEEGLEKVDFEYINRKNLMEGKDSFGNDMPRYKNPEYANFKTSINPKNRGFWDLRVTGEYHRFLKVRFFPSVVFFFNDLNNDKAIWLKQMLGNRHIGITEEQMFQVQLDNKPFLKKKLLEMINGK